MTGGELDGKGDDSEPKIEEILRGIETRMVKQTSMTPEQGCLGCGLGIGLLLLTLIVWLVIYWYYNPEFHDRPAPLPALLAPKELPARAGLPVQRHIDHERK